MGPNVECSAFTPTKNQLKVAVQRCFDTSGNWLTIDAHCNNINNWDVSRVTEMNYLFKNTAFNEDISAWDVSSVTNMHQMFHGASAFDQPLNNWDVSSVTDMHQMFHGASAFDQPLNNWDVSSITDMGGIFCCVGSTNC